VTGGNRQVYFFFVLGTACERALPAAFFESFPVLLSLKTLEAELAAALLFFMIFIYIEQPNVINRPEEKKKDLLKLPIVIRTFEVHYDV
jgi:hypothetical protein